MLTDSDRFLSELAVIWLQLSIINFILYVTGTWARGWPAAALALICQVKPYWALASGTGGCLPPPGHGEGKGILCIVI